MNNIQNVVFITTPQGFAAMRNKNLAIPLDFMTVLILVDGICPVAQYIPFLQLFEPLEPKFLYLEKSGLITRHRAASISEV